MHLSRQARGKHRAELLLMALPPDYQPAVSVFAVSRKARKASNIESKTKDIEMKTNLFVFVSSSTDVRMRTPKHRTIAPVRAFTRIRIDDAHGIHARGAALRPCTVLCFASSRSLPDTGSGPAVTGFPRNPTASSLAFTQARAAGTRFQLHCRR